jgi:hypothetical protein
MDVGCRKERGANAVGLVDSVTNMSRWKFWLLWSLMIALLFVLWPVLVVIERVWPPREEECLERDDPPLVE